MEKGTGFPEQSPCLSPVGPPSAQASCEQSYFKARPMTQNLRWDYHAQVAFFFHLCNLPEAASISLFLCGVREDSFAIPQE